MKDIYFFDKQVKDFIEELFKKTSLEVFSWRPLDDFLFSDTSISVALLDLADIIYGETIIKFFKDDSFFLSKNNSYLFLLHVSQRSQSDKKEKDNYILYGALNKFEHIICMGGLSKVTKLQEKNAERLIDLCHLIKFKHGNCIVREKDELDSVTSIIKNILSTE